MKPFMDYNRRKKGKHGIVALKLDIQKAYDTVEWQCLEYVFKAHEFCDKWVHMIMQCVSMVRINGSQTPFFIPQRRL